MKIELRVFKNKLPIYIFSKSKLKSLSGMLQIFYKKKWATISYLQYKDALKICSFFYFNYGTLLVDDRPEIENGKKLNLIKTFDTIECSKNSTEPKFCKFKNFR